jgi:cystathionine beta-lyase family protein involved in aluminum resistance
MQEVMKMITKTWNQQIEEKISPVVQRINVHVEQMQKRVLDAFRQHQISEAHLQDSTGYGYDDIGREAFEAVFAQMMGAEKALVRPHLVSGTHAIATVLFGVLRPGDELIYLSGEPYDTLQKVIGQIPDGSGTLVDFGIHYQSIPLREDGQVDWTSFQKAKSERTKMVAIQRSKGYVSRPSFTLAQIKEMIQQIRKLCPQAVIFVDNCYGEWVEAQEPPHVGADLIAGSLIKNPGGGLAKSGGYIAGKKQWVERVAGRMTAPGIAAEVGATYGYMRDFFQGLFLAPHVVGEALKGMVFAAAALQEEGFATSPTWDESRADIVQQVTLGRADRLVAFCQGIQSCSPIDSYLRLEPAPMPGYSDSIVMAAGTFVSGASIELSADGPLRPPYIAYLQGGLTYAHVKIAIREAIANLQRLS